MLLFGEIIFSTGYPAIKLAGCPANSVPGATLKCIYIILGWIDRPRKEKYESVLSNYRQLKFISRSWQIVELKVSETYSFILPGLYIAFYIKKDSPRTFLKFNS